MMTKLSKPIAAIALAFVCGLPISQVYGQSQSLPARFGEANERYEQGDYAGAITLYLEVEREGVEHPDLYYNLGNAYYKTSDLGRAVLYYERSLRLAPRNRDATENLQLVRSQLKDKQFVAGQNSIVRGLIWFHNNLNASEMILVLSVSWVALCAVIMLMILRDTAVVRAMYRRFSILSPGRFLGLRMTQDLLLAAAIVATLAVTAGVSAYTKVTNARNGTDAVVLTEEVDVYSSPTGDATLQFKIHSGTMVDIVERRTEWVRIQLPGKLSGWVESGTVESV